MNTSLDPKARSFLTSLNQIQSRNERAQSQITSGRRVQQPSDDPAGVSRILSLATQVERTGRLRGDLELVRGEVEAADSALQQAVRLLEKAGSLSAQGASEILPPDKRALLAVEARDLLQSLVGITQTSVNGRYLFGGDQDRVAPFEFDPSVAGGVRQVQNAPASRRIANLAGDTFPVDRTAGQIFDARKADGSPEEHNVFGAVSELIAALESNDTAALSSLVRKLRSAGDHVNHELSRYGLVHNRLSTEIELTQSTELQLRTRLSEVQDTDMTSAILELTQTRQQLEAAISARGQMPRSTLFDILG
mgnify:CR=1 FL=1